MIPYERHERILELLRQSDIVKIADLQEELPEVSASTLRRDLKELAGMGKLEHLTGGAVKLITVSHEVNIFTRSAQHSAEKEAIARVAAGFVDDGDTLYLDSGSTCSALLRLLLDRDVVIYTTDGTACSIQGDTRAQIMVVGGEFHALNSSMCGPLTESVLRELFFDKAFIGVNAVDEDRGIMTPSYEEASKKRIVRQNSAQAFVLCDSSKFHGTSNVVAFGLEGVTIVSERSDDQIAAAARLVTP